MNDWFTTHIPGIFISNGCPYQHCDTFSILSCISPAWHLIKFCFWGIINHLHKCVLNNDSSLCVDLVECCLWIIMLAGNQYITITALSCDHDSFLSWCLCNEWTRHLWLGNYGMLVMTISHNILVAFCSTCWSRSNHSHCCVRHRPEVWTFDCGYWAISNLLSIRHEVLV